LSENFKISLFPLIRHLSRLITPVLLRLPVSPNQITAASLITGLASAWFVMKGDFFFDIIAGLLFIITYVLDNCDGEVARIKKQCSSFGMRFDSFVDWVVHSALFTAMGYGLADRFVDDIWYWLGITAAIGGTINYIIGFYIDVREIAEAETLEAWEERKTGATSRKPEGLGDWSLFVFRELIRADFCFILLGFAAFDLLWILVPAGAIGAQFYWISQLFRGASDFHV